MHIDDLLRPEERLLVGYWSRWLYRLTYYDTTYCWRRAMMLMPAQEWRKLDKESAEQVVRDLRELATINAKGVDA